MASEETKITSGSLIAAEKVEGTDVYNMQGEKLGTVDDIMIDKVSGRRSAPSCRSAASSDRREVPSAALADADLRREQGRLVVNLDKRILESAPSYGMNEDFRWTSDYGRQVDKYYSAPSYW